MMDYGNNIADRALALHMSDPGLIPGTLEGFQNPDRSDFLVQSQEDVLSVTVCTPLNNNHNN